MFGVNVDKQEAFTIVGPDHAIVGQGEVDGVLHVPDLNVIVVEATILGSKVLEELVTGGDAEVGVAKASLIAFKWLENHPTFVKDKLDSLRKKGSELAF